MVLSSQLVVAVADQLPRFDIARSCKLDDASYGWGLCRSAIKKVHR
jgi:hypothetical protein